MEFTELELNLSIEERVRIHNLVESHNLSGIMEAIGRHGIGILRAQLQYKVQPEYPNSGTMAHWAVWYRHWIVLKLLVRVGIDLTITGTGRSMNRTVREYAEWLDQHCGHRYYKHVQYFDDVIAHPESVPEIEDFTAGEVGSIGRASLLKLHSFVECNDLAKLQAAFVLIGPQMGNLVIPSFDSPACSSLAHWAVWYCHWNVCEWLESVNCFPASFRPAGSWGWVSGRTPMEYAHELDRQSGHGWYRHVHELQQALIRGRALRATTTLPLPASATQDQDPTNIDVMWQEILPYNVVRSNGTCGICQDVHDHRYTLSSQCGHAFCSNDISRYVTLVLESGPFPIRCPSCQISASAPQSFVTRSILKGLANENVITNSVAQRVLRQQLLHLDDEVTVDLLQRTSKPCPSCQTPISHYKGHACHHIKPGGGCPGCHHHFCYVCLFDSGLTWTGCPNRCPPFCNDVCGCPRCPDCVPGHSCASCQGCQVCNI